MIRPNRHLSLAALTAFAFVVACASSPELPPGFLDEKTKVEENTPLGGESLAQRKHEMKRAYSDLLHFHVTLESLHQRKDRNGLILFSDFTETYMGKHLQPLLRSEWQSQQDRERRAREQGLRSHAPSASSCSPGGAGGSVWRASTGGCDMDLSRSRGSSRSR